MQEILKWAGALAALVGFALSLGLNPALYGATATALTINKRVMAKLWWLTGGLAAGATILFFALRTFDPTSLVHTLQGRVDAALLNLWVDLAAGALFLLAAAATVVWKIRGPLPEREAKPATTNSRPYSYFVIGLTSAIVGFTTLPIMYLVGRVVNAVSDDVLLRLLAYAVFLIALCGPFFLIAWVWSRFPGLTKRIQEVAALVQRWDYRWALACFFAVAGLVFIALAIFAHR